MTGMGVARCIWPVRAALGEGAFWSENNQSVWFVDILGQAIHRCAPDGTARETWRTPQRVGFALDTAQGDMIVGLADGLYRWRPGSAFEPVVQVLSTPVDRLNDGTVSPDGSLWFGTKNEAESAPTGAWFRWDGRRHPEIVDKGYVVTNGPAFSPDGGKAYFSDSVNRHVFARHIDAAGAIGPMEPLLQIEEGAGYPDGLAVDVSGCVWVALWAGWALRQYSPTGELLQTIPLPCANVTKPAFGGPDGTTLFVTTAATGLSPRELAAQPLAGGLFEIRTGGRGSPIPAFG